MLLSREESWSCQMEGVICDKFWATTRGRRAVLGDSAVNVKNDSYEGKVGLG